MRAPVVVRCSLLLLAFSIPTFACAQFQPPTDEELKMTADPKAPGAAAVYLNREETSNDAIHFQSYYERIKVLTEKGKELATIRIPYEHGQFRVNGIKGRTIHSDGTIIPLTAKPTDLVDVKSVTYQVNTMVFTLPSVEVGSILEYKLDINYDDNVVLAPTWKIQQPYFVHKAHYFFKPASVGNMHYITDSHDRVLNRLYYSVTSLPPEKVVQMANGDYMVDLTDIPPSPNEDWMPPLNTINQRVEFYYTFAVSGKNYWDEEGKRWAKDAERFTNPGGQIKKAVAEIVAPTDSDEQKARKIYAAVMKLDNTDFSRKMSEAERKAAKIKTVKDAEDVWKQQSGSGDEIALLYVTLARAAGLKVWPMEVVDRSRAVFDASYMRVAQLDDYIAIVSIGGEDVFLDPGQKMCPYGLMHWKHTYTAGLRLADKGAALAPTGGATYKTAVVKRFADIEIDPTGAAKGTVHLTMVGPEALRWRHVALQNDPEEVKKRFNESIRDDLPDGIIPDFDNFTGLDDYNANLVANVKITGRIGTITGKRLFLPGQFFESHGKHPFVEQEKRTTPIDVRYARMSQDDVIYHLPPGFAVESVPEATNISWPGNAMLKANSISNLSSVQATRTLAYNYTLMDPKEYGSLRDFYLKVATADQQQVVLARIPGAIGN